jgi:hypothetical protein
MKECFEIINSFLSNSNKVFQSNIDRLEKVAGQLSISFPPSFTEFYKYFGDNNEVLKAFFNFHCIEDIQISNDAVIFCQGHQTERIFGILLSDINKENPPIKLMDVGDEKWYSACFFSTSFFINMACWQVVNAMPSMAKIKIDENKLKSKIEAYLMPISQEKNVFLGYDFFSYYNHQKKILSSYFKDSGQLFVASKDDVYLNEFESESGLELDWC